MDLIIAILPVVTKDPSVCGDIIVGVCMYVCMYSPHLYSIKQSIVLFNHTRYMIANPARGQLNREIVFFPLSPFAPDNFASRDGFARPVPRQPAHSEHSS